MQLKTLLPAALAWSSATGLMVPPETSGDALMAMKADPANHDNVFRVNVPCNGCVVAQDKNEEGVRSFDESGDKNTDIVLEFSQRDNSIFLGNTRIYPVTAEIANAISGKQVKNEASGDDFDVTEDEIRLSTRLDVNGKQQLSETVSGTELALEVLGIEDHVVHVGTVVVHVLESSTDGSVALMSPPTVLATLTTPMDAQCATVLCRVRAQLIAKLSAMKAAAGKAAGKIKSGCAKMMGMHGGRPHHGAPHRHGETDGKTSPLDRIKGGPKKYKGHHAHHGNGRLGGAGGRKPCPGRHGFMGRMAHGVAAFARHVLMPIMVGVAAGMAVSALGMVIGQLVFMIYTRLRARRNGGYIAVYQVVDTEAGDDDDDEPLPVYQAGEHYLPPAYEDEKKEEQQN